MSRNPVARDLRSPKYRPRVVSNKRHGDWKRDDTDADNASQCDCCGENKQGCVNIIAYGLDCHACPECRGHEDE